jgi:hypothetical protein
MTKITDNTTFKAWVNTHSTRDATLVAVAGITGCSLTTVMNWMSTQILTARNASLINAAIAKGDLPS